MIAEPDELDAALDEAKAFVAFLGDAGLLDKGSDDPRVLADHAGLTWRRGGDAVVAATRP